jgi:hypothetical protein
VVAPRIPRQYILIIPFSGYASCIMEKPTDFSFIVKDDSNFSSVLSNC